MNYGLILIIIIVLLILICICVYFSKQNKNDHKLIFINYTDAPTAVQITSYKTGKIIYCSDVNTGQRVEFYDPNQSVNIIFTNPINADKSVQHTNFVLNNQHVKIIIHNEGNFTDFYDNFTDTLDPTVTLNFPEEVYIQENDNNEPINFIVIKNLYITVNKISYNVLKDKIFKSNVVTIPNVPLNKLSANECFGLFSPGGLINFGISNTNYTLFINNTPSTVIVNTSLNYNLIVDFQADNLIYFKFNTNDICF